MLAGMKSEWVAGFVSESMAGFIGIRSLLLDTASVEASLRYRKEKVRSHLRDGLQVSAPGYRVG